MAMRYYEYLSTAKVEMLYPQVDQTSRSAGGEVGFDLKVIKASRKTDGMKQPTLYEKLAAVEDWIYAHEPVGNIDEPQAWIYGRMPMAATVMTQAWEVPTAEQRRQSAALFAACSDTGSYLVLAGAARHLVLANNLPQVSELEDFSSSISMLRLLLQNYPGLKDARATGNDRICGPNPYLEYLAAAANMLTCADLLGYASKHEFEFLAKRVDTAPGKGPTATLATPLFVALAD